MDHLAGQALAPEGLVEVEVERHGVGSGALHLVALERLDTGLLVYGPGRGALVAVVDRQGAAGAQGGPRAVSVVRGRWVGPFGHPFSEAGPERSVVGIEREAA